MFWRVIGLRRYSAPFFPFGRIGSRALLLLLPSLPVFRGTSKGNLQRNPRPRRLWERKHEIAILRTPCSEAFIDNQIPILSSFIFAPPSPGFVEGPSSLVSSKNSLATSVSTVPSSVTFRWKEEEGELSLPPLFVSARSSMGSRRTRGG